MLRQVQHHVIIDIKQTIIHTLSRVQSPSFVDTIHPVNN